MVANFRMQRRPAGVGAGPAMLALGALGLVVLVALRLEPWLADETNAVLFLHLTGSRLASALIAGAGLGAAGALLQGLARNPLASPGVLGVTAGAHLAIVVALAFAHGSVALIVAAFLGAVAAMAITWTLAGPGGREGAGLALAGVAVNLCLSAFAGALTLVQTQRMAAAFVWSAGAPIEAGWGPLRELVPWVVAGLVVAMPLARSLDALALGSNMARAVGVAPGHLTAVAFAATGLAAGGGVALVGPVAFIGLLAPNGLRRIGVQRHAWLLPLSALWGAVLLAGADWLADFVSGSGREVPPGVISAVVGAPAFLWLIARSRRRGAVGEAAWRTGGRSGLVPAVAAVCLVAVVVASLAVGETMYSPMTLWQVVTGNAEAVASLVVLELRLPRLLVALCGGALLALAGQLLQGVLRNPLAGPETLGITQGAALCALFALLAGAAPGGVIMQAAALAGALGAVAVVFVVAGRSGFAPLLLMLGGIALAALFASLAALVLMISQLKSTQVLVWLSGSVYARSWPALWQVLPLAAAVFVAAIWLGRRLDVVGLGREKAVALGLGVARTRMIACSLATAATAAAVSVVGSITFVGLLAPHLARMLYGGTFRARLPMTLACGAAITAGADLVGRTVVAPMQLPAGIMTSLVGAPYFLWLLRRSRP